jgi:anti-sigma B factor antagonist
MLGMRLYDPAPLRCVDRLWERETSRGRTYTEAREHGGGVLVNTTRRSDGSIVVEIRGELDVSTVERLRQVLTDAAALRPRRIVVDLAHVTFIDSTGLGALVRGHSAAHALGVGYLARHPSPFVALQLRKIGLYDTLITET